MRTSKIYSSGLFKGNVDNYVDNLLKTPRKNAKKFSKTGVLGEKCEKSVCYYIIEAYNRINEQRVGRKARLFFSAFSVKGGRKYEFPYLAM